MKRYSMENRNNGRPSKKSRFSFEMKKQIMYDYVIKKLPLEQIHNNYRHICSYSYFSNLPAAWYSNLEINDYILQHLMTEEDYLRFKGKVGILGNKYSSYWSNEEEVLFKPITKEDLSEEELSIYLKND